MRVFQIVFSVLGIMLIFTVHAAETGVRIKELARVAGVRDNALVGYGLAIGLSGSGDSARNKATVQTVVNTLANFGVVVNPNDISSRNVAAVMVTATLPPFAETGDKLDVQVSSIGDARSLQGGTLLLTPLYGPDELLYSLAQGSISTGGYRFESFDSSYQKNHPTVGAIPDGATVERSIKGQLPVETDHIALLLNEPDFTTAQRISEAVSALFPRAEVTPAHAGKIDINFADAVANAIPLIAQIENTRVAPDQRARVVINERTGTVVAGGEVRIADVSISHGNLRVQVDTYYDVSQPSLVFKPSDSVRTAVVPETEIEVSEEDGGTVAMPAGTTVADLVGALRLINMKTRDIITILQAIKGAGALHGELVIQ